MKNIGRFEFYVAFLLLTFCVISNLALWNLMLKGEPADFNSLSVSLAALEIFLIVVAVGGFWTLRGLTRERAEEVAIEETKRIAEKEVPSMAKRIVNDYLNSLDINVDGLSDDAANDIKDEF
jgi:hypothetical protein